jgi:hypothetical protein
VSEREYIDIRNATAVSIIGARIATCAQKSFDGIEPDVDDSHTENTGFPISMADNVTYLTMLSDYAHGLGLASGLAWGLKSGADDGDPASFIGQVLPRVDLGIVERPFFLTVIGAEKALFVAEYTNDTSSASAFCPQALAAQTNAALVRGSRSTGARREGADALSVSGSDAAFLQ